MTMAGTPAGPELMNRLLGRNKKDFEQKNPVGRPPDPVSPTTSVDDLTLFLNSNDPLKTNVVTKPDDETIWAAGSIIQVLAGDGSGNTTSYVLGNDLKVYSM